jgi:hypothetical protein
VSHSIAGPSRVAFLYIAQRHQVLHSLSSAVALARARPDVAVDVVASSQSVLDYAHTLVRRLGGAPLGWRLLGPAWLRNLPHIDSAPPKAPLLAAAARDLAGYTPSTAPATGPGRSSLGWPRSTWCSPQVRSSGIAC